LLFPEKKIEQAPVEELAVYVVEIPTTPQEYARMKMSESDFYYFDLIVKKESNWRNTVKNPNSSAYGIGQFLDSTWKSVGCEKTDDPYVQIDCMMDYINIRYGSPQKAYQFHLINNWY
jgi:hypothetical protein